MMASPTSTTSTSASEPIFEVNMARFDGSSRLLRCFELLSGGPRSPRSAWTRTAASTRPFEKALAPGRKRHAARLRGEVSSHRPPMSEAVEPLVDCEAQVLDRPRLRRRHVVALVSSALLALALCRGRAAEEVSEVSEVLEMFDLSGMATPKCWKNKTFYVESSGKFSMASTAKSQVLSAAACQQLCLSTKGCEHFSFWLDGGCLLTSFGATPKPYKGPLDNGVISGPKECKVINNGPTMVFEASTKGLPKFHAHEAGGCGSLHDQYKLAWAAEGESFFDDWQFINKSQTRGAEWYLNKSEAFYQGVVHASKSGAILRVGEQVQPFKRRSVMLHTAQAWRPDVGFMVVMKCLRLP